MSDLLAGLDAWLAANPLSEKAAATPAQPSALQITAQLAPGPDAAREESPTPPPAPQPEPANPTDWHAARGTYYRHHFSCPQCSAAGSGQGQRCLAGAELWRAYQAAPIPDRREQARERYVAELEAERELHWLLGAAMRACDYWGDDNAACEQMRRDCMEVPSEQRAELRDLFLREYGDGLFKQGENRDEHT